MSDTATSSTNMQVSTSDGKSPVRRSKPLSPHCKYWFLVEHCGYGAMHDEMVQDRIVVGLRDVHLSEKMQLEADLTLEKAITQARQAESHRPVVPFMPAAARTSTSKAPRSPIPAASDRCEVGLHLVHFGQSCQLHMFNYVPLPSMCLTRIPTRHCPQCAM